MKTPMTKTPTKETNLIVRPAEVVPREESEYPPLASQEEIEKVLRLVDANLSGPETDIQKFPKIKPPAAGSDMLIVESPAGRKSVHELEGIVLAYRRARLYYKKPYGSGGVKRPPDCASTDTFVGIGDPAPLDAKPQPGRHNCLECPNAQFGTALMGDGKTRGAGQACKEVRQSLVLLPGQLLPYMFAIPPTSLRNFDRYAQNVPWGGAPWWGVVTRMVPEISQSESYARVHFFEARKFDRTKAQWLDAFHERLQALLKPMVVDGSAYEIPEEEARDAPPPTDDETPF